MNPKSALGPYWWLFIDVHGDMTKFAGLAVGTVRDRYWPGFCKNFRLNPTPYTCFDVNFYQEEGVEEQRSVEPGVDRAPWVVGCHEGVE